MIKYIPQFSCWSLGANCYLVVASCANTGEVMVYTLDGGVTIDTLPDSVPFPDLRCFKPCKWQAIPARQRAKVRATFQVLLESMYGAEEHPTPGAWQAWQ